MSRVLKHLVKAATPLAAYCLVAGFAGVSRAADQPQLHGQWNLNQAQSDDAREKIREAQEKSASARRDSGGGNPNGGTYPGGGYPGGGYPGGGMGVGVGGVGIGGIGGVGGGMGRRRGTGNPNQGGGVSSQVWDTLAESPNHLKIDQREDYVVISDDADHTRTLHPDGKKHEQQDANGKKTTTKTDWKGDALITETKLSHSAKLTETYRVTTDGKQLYVVSQLDDPSLAGPLSIRRVYDLAEAPAR
ncbi:MAG: hypothetical protein ABSF14_10865 [Terriglobia bacterium]|jgi:hypothetical protein